MTTINLYISDDKGSQNSGDEFSQGNLPVPMMEVTDFSGVDASIPTPQDFEQKDISVAGGNEVPRPEYFENIQNSGSDFVPSPMQEESTMQMENSGGMHPSPMDSEELNTVKDTKKTVKSPVSKSSKK